MHDPMTVAFDIKYPWRGKPDKFNQKGRRDTFITIWHRDPERGGSDDSCGWFAPRLTKEQVRRLRILASDEAENPYFLRCKAKEWRGTRTEAESLYRGLVLCVAGYIGLRVTFTEAAQMAVERIHQPGYIDGAKVLCFLPGYHSNFDEDAPSDREDVIFGTACGIARELLRARRWWFRHPRWHVWHWRIQVHPTQAFKRWVFSRCDACGKRFPYGYSPVSTSWNGTGPRWFRSESRVYHHNCRDAQVAMRREDEE